jgi:hypothetical protein
MPHSGVRCSLSPDDTPTEPPPAMMSLEELIAEIEAVRQPVKPPNP